VGDHDKQFYFEKEGDSEEVIASFDCFYLKFAFNAFKIDFDKLDVPT